MVCTWVQVTCARGCCMVAVLWLRISCSLYRTVLSLACWVTNGLLGYQRVSVFFKIKISTPPPPLFL